MNMQVDRSEIETKRGMSKKTLNRAWLITGLLILFQMINFADKAVLGLVAESVMSELGMTSTQFGFIGSSFFSYSRYRALLWGLLPKKYKPDGSF